MKEHGLEGLEGLEMEERKEPGAVRHGLDLGPFHLFGGPYE